jgi:tetratricopeptide (TPR) repeat protein
MLPTSLQLGGRPVSYALRRIDTLTQTYPNPMINLFRAVLLAMNDEIEEARALAVATHDRMRELSEGTLPSAMLAEIEALAGNDEAAAELLRIHCDRLAGTGQIALLSTYGAMYGNILVALGRVEEAERLATQSRDTGDPNDPVTQALWRQVSAKVHSHRGDYAEAARLAGEAVTFTQQTDSPKFQADALADLAGVLDVAGRHDEAVAALRDALDQYELKQIVPLARRTRKRLTEMSGP